MITKYSIRGNSIDYFDRYLRWALFVDINAPLQKYQEPTLLDKPDD